MPQAAHRLGLVDDAKLTREGVISAPSKSGLCYEAYLEWTESHKVASLEYNATQPARGARPPKPTSTEPVAQLSKFPRVPVGVTFSSRSMWLPAASRQCRSRASHAGYEGRLMQTPLR